MEFKILGPLEVVTADHRLPLDRRQLRLLLAVLLCHPGQPVSPDRLIEALWGSRSAPSAASNLHVYIHRLRKVLGYDRVVGRSGAGYTLTVRTGELDAHRFIELGAAGQAALEAADPVKAAQRLREALALWRGEPFSDLTGEPALREESARLVEHRLIFLEHRIDADLGLVRHTDLIPELSALVAEHPYRERFGWQLMLALYRSGRQADALATYRAIRRTLADELGLEPGPALRELEAAILAADPDLEPPDRAAITLTAPGLRTDGGADGTGPARPAQLPAGIAEFTGRETQLKRLEELAELADQDAVALSIITGAAGVGKTALAIHWAHQVADRFPDAQLYVDLRGYDRAEPIPPIRVLGGFLRALGIPPDRIPNDLDEAASLYRSLLAGTRALVLLDNAGSVDQVRPLLPGARGCLVLITSRDRLAGLVAREGARSLLLEVMSSGEAVDLLTRVVGPERVFHEMSQTVELAAACGGLPLALRISAAHLVDQPGRTIAEHLRELTAGDRLAALEIDGDSSSAVRAAFDQSYTRLPGGARRAFRLLGLAPGPDVTPAAAGALLAEPAAATTRLLTRLADAHLIERLVPGRFTFHDLVREYARTRAAEEDGPAECSAALGRLYEYYLDRTDAAARMLYPTILRLPMPGGPRSDFEDPEAAIRWLDSEQHNIVTAALRAQDLGLPSMAWRLADPMRLYLWVRRNTVESPLVAGAAVAAAKAGGDLSEQAVALFSLGVAHMCSARYRLAVEAYAEALPLTRRAGWTEAEAAALANIATLRLELGELADAAAKYGEAVEVYRRLGLPRQEALHLCSLATVEMRAGRLHEAAGYAEATGARLAGLDAPAIEAIAVGVHAEICRHLGRYAEAVEHATRCLQLARQVERPDAEAAARCQLAAVALLTGDPAEALRLARPGYELAVQVGDRAVEAELVNVLGHIDVELGRHEPASGHFLTALTIARESDVPYPETDAGLGLATAYHRLGLVDAALSHARAAVGVAGELGFRMLEGQGRTLLAEILGGMADPAAGAESEAYAEAEAEARRALDIQRGTGHRLGEARAMLVLGRLIGGEQAQQHRRAARELFAELGVPVPGRIGRG